MSSKTVLFLLIIIGICDSLASSRDGECTDLGDRPTALNLFMDRRFNITRGQWVTAVSARHVDAEDRTVDMDLEATHTVTECQGRRVVHMKMVAIEKDGNQSSNSYDRDLIRSRPKRDQIVFHHRHAKNIKVFNDGLSAFRLDLAEPHYSSLFSNRPLRDEELFEVRLDKKKGSSGGCLGIGIMTASPEDVNILREMYQSDVVWMYYDTSVYRNGKQVKTGYGTNLNIVQEGTRVGVMRRRDGTLHFYVNGIDQGVAVSSVPANAYGICDLRMDAMVGTIVS